MPQSTGDVERYITAGESMKVEFKSDRRQAVSDREIFETAVCLANAEGGLILIGVEDDGKVTGARCESWRTSSTMWCQSHEVLNWLRP